MDPCPEMFRDDNKKITKIHFSVRVNVATEPIVESDLRNLLIKLRKQDPRFKKCDQGMAPDGSAGIIHHRDGLRSIEMTRDRINYTESDKFDRHSFNSISKSIYEYYLDVKKVELDQIKLVGKIYFLSFDIGKPAVEWTAERLRLYRDFTPLYFDIRTTMLVDDLNLHLYVSAKSDDDDEDSSPDIKVQLDVNNHNQEDGIKDDTINKVIDFIDNFQKDRLIEVLNTNFGLQS